MPMPRACLPAKPKLADAERVWGNCLRSKPRRVDKFTPYVLTAATWWKLLLHVRGRNRQTFTHPIRFQPSSLPMNVHLGVYYYRSTRTTADSPDGFVIVLLAVLIPPHNPSKYCCRSSEVPPPSASQRYFNHNTTSSTRHRLSSPPFQTQKATFVIEQHQIYSCSGVANRAQRVHNNKHNPHLRIGDTRRSQQARNAAGEYPRRSELGNGRIYPHHNTAVHQAAAPPIMDDYDYDDYDFDDAWLYAEDEFDLAVSNLTCNSFYFH